VQRSVRVIRWPRAAALIGLAWALAALGFASRVSAAPPVRSLIVQLKDAPAHEALDRAQPLDSNRDAEIARQLPRWQRLLADARLAVPGVAPTSRPTGRAAHRIDFGRALSAREIDDLLARLGASPDVEWVVPNEREQRLQNVVPSDPMFAGYSGQWWLQPAGGSDANSIEARLRGVPGLQRGWLLSTGAAAVPVAVLDTGATAHSELAGRMLPGYDMVSDVEYANDGDGRDPNPSDPGDWISAAERNDAAFKDCRLQDSSWHGTVIAGLVAARTDNNAGVAAISWQGRVVPVRVAGKCGAAVADIVDGMRWAAGLAVPDGQGGWLPRNPNPARVISISFGGDAVCNRAYQDAIDELHAIGVVVVAAAGNGHGAVTRPASCAKVVAVAALNRDGFKTSYSSFGPQVTIATVGGDDASGAWGALLSDQGLLTIVNHGLAGPGAAGFARSAGTSFAAPIVAGTISLMWSVNPALSVDQVVAGITVSARPHVTSPWIAACSFANPGRCLCSTATCGAGILDAEQAMLYASAPANYAVPARSAEILDNTDLREAAALGPDRPGQAVSVPEPPSGGGGSLQLGGLLALLAAALLLKVLPRRV